MEKVVFIAEKKEEKLAETLREELKSLKGKTAVKLHMGEAGNNYFLKPEFVKKIIGVLKELKTEPFLFDSPVIYPGGRDSVKKYYETAKQHGFTEENIGCPIVISDDSKVIKTKHLDAEVCMPLIEADSILVLSHVKGHMCSGFGGAIKNLGMGGMSVKTKTDIHGLANPVFSGECIGCGTCVKACPVGAISLKNKKAEFNYDCCWGCDQCVIMCPEKVLKPKVASFDTLLSEGAAAVIKKKNSYCINVIKDITKLCDCCSDPEGIVLDNIGIVMGRDIVAVEKASLDLINKKAGKDLFEEIHKKSPLVHIKEAEKPGLGSLDYKLEVK